MIGFRHYDLLEKISGYMPHLTNGNFRSLDFFIESTYQDAKGEPRPCYLLIRCHLGATKSFRFIPKGGEIPRYNLGEIISLTFDTYVEGHDPTSGIFRRLTDPILDWSIITENSGLTERNFPLSAGGEIPPSVRHTLRRLRWAENSAE